ncbi:MAG: rRNA pseudouridine synthase [Candidatus Magnetominusculus sp. LBB02]|nr:rRNA pseudouridine synthase [Candidatus Magnetominusculus sp. LBB02]
MEERLQKIIASSGITSRRKAEEMILEGRVTVNGKAAVIGMKADIERDHIKVDGKLINPKAANQRRVYIKFNKPDEVVTTLTDPEGRATVADYLAGIGERVYPVGRLDYHTEGLLLLTNDGDLAFAILHPAKKIPKTYHVKVKGEITEASLDKLRRGVRLEDGMTMPAEIKRLKSKDTVSNTWLEIIIYEGRKRQIRRMFTYVKHPVAKLKRVAINGITLGNLKPGQWAYMTQDELHTIFKEVGVKPDRRTHVP